MPAENSARLLGKGHFWGKEKVKDFKDFMARAQRALWSAKSVGLEVEFIAMKEVKTGSKHNAKMVSDEQQENTATGLDSFLEEEKEQLDQILFLLDKLFVGDFVLSWALHD